MFLPQEVIRKKRDKGILSTHEISTFVSGYARGEIPDYQMSALAMAITLNGCNESETAAFLKAMMASGRRYDWSARRPSRLYVDKHSTGGVGDKTSLVILPLLVADGLDVPMVSGRGLGHTGGTLDKLESLPGLRTRVPMETYVGWVDDAHGAFGAQTDEFVPADKKLYALRDVTATVESQALIVASIMSKKLAEDLDALVLDVKFGSGAFMSRPEDALALAEALVRAGRAAGCRVSAALTNMDEPLGRAAGNALEVAECLDCLQGGGPLDTRELSLQLAARVACDARRETGDASLAKAYARMKEHLTSGRAFEIFCRIACLQGARIEDVERRSTAWITKDVVEVEVLGETSGVVAAIDTRALGLAVLGLGGGRRATDDIIHPGVGISRIAKVGEQVSAGDPLCVVHRSASKSDVAEILTAVRSAFSIAPAARPPTPLPLIAQWI